MTPYVHQAHDLEEFTEGPNPTVCSSCLGPYHGDEPCPLCQRCGDPFHGSRRCGTQPSRGRPGESVECSCTGVGP